MTFTHALATNNYGCAKFIVATSAANGTHTTLASAMAAASVGDTIFLRDTVTENVTITPGVNIAAWDGEKSTPAIIGTLTMTGAGTSTISGLLLQTNSAVVIAVTGSAASILNVNNCFFNLTNNTGITFSSSSSSAAIAINKSRVDTGTTGIAYFSDSSAGTLSIQNTELLNTGASTTACTKSAGQLILQFCRFRLPLTYSSSNTSSDIFSCIVNTAATNTTFLTTSGTGTLTINQTNIATGSASSISIGSGTSVTVNQSTVNTSNTNAITGAGIINYSIISFSGTSSNINTTTQNLLNVGPSILVGSSNSGNTNSLTVTNSSNTATSSANIVSTVGGSTAADATYQAVVSGVTTWTWGVDNSDSDAWVLAQGTALGTNNVIHATTAGEITYPLQPAFLVYLNTTVTNVSGDGTTYTVIFDTEVFDQGSDFNLGTGIFTAPVTGKYHFDAYLSIIGGTAITVPLLRINATSNIYRATMPVAPGGTTSVQGNSSVLVDMTAGDTAKVLFSSTDSGGKIDDVAGLGGSDPRTWFSGALTV